MDRPYANILSHWKNGWRLEMPNLAKYLDGLQVKLFPTSYRKIKSSLLNLFLGWVFPGHFGAHIGENTIADTIEFL
jgi:hypothetical protein